MKNFLLKVTFGLVLVAVIGTRWIAEPVQGQSNWDFDLPEPSYPTLLNPQSVEDVMPYARAAVRNEAGFAGYGIGALNAGEKAIIVPRTTDPDSEIYIDAIIKAAKERDVTLIRMDEHEIVRVTLEQARDVEQAIAELGLKETAEHGWMEACEFFNERRWKAREYLQKEHPDLYSLCNPPAIEKQLSSELIKVHEKLAAAPRVVPDYLNDYLEKHPDIRGVFYGSGGPMWMRFAPQSDNWLGFFTFDNRWEAASPMVEFPADVWLMVDEKVIEPAAAVDRVEIKDPEGTDVWWEMTEQQAQWWAESMYIRGHINLFAQQGFGSIGGVSNLEYPPQGDEWIPATPMVRLNGTVAGHGGHSGFYPRLEQVWEDGYLQEIRGGGAFGDLLRALYDVPGIHEKVWPLREEPGFFWHWETSVGTNPKALRPDITRERLRAERMRDGIIHWGHGVQHLNDPDADHPQQPGRLGPEFEKKTGLPASHGFHIHTYFNNLRVRIRGSDRWLTLFDEGRSTAMDSPEVRALASRYGDPDKILATEWIPDIPGINAPGDYEEFSRAPYKHTAAVMEQIKAGTYNKYNPHVRSPEEAE